MVSDKMENAFNADLHSQQEDNRNVNTSIQAAIDAAWTKFDPEDLETWPSNPYTPGGHEWLGIDVKGDPYGVMFDDDGSYAHFMELRECTPVTVVCYADPADLMPSFNKREEKSYEVPQTTDCD